MDDQQLARESVWEGKVRKDYHHICWYRRIWRKDLWSRRVREHPYMVVLIPADTLHRKIHRTMEKGILRPNEFACEVVWHELEELRVSELIDIKQDGLEQRLNILIELFSHCGENTDETVESLLAQKYIVRKFYQNPSL